MQMDNSLLERMPFPYFIINADLQILFSSKSAKRIFSSPASFSELISTSQADELREFLNSKSETTCLELKMTGRTEQIEVFHIYKLISSDGSIHLFCVPNGSDQSEIQNMLDHVENKISSINGELLTNKQNFDQTVFQIKEAAILSDQLATIGQLAAGIAHEIRNPLTTVKGFIQLIQPYLAEIGKEEYAVIALDEIERANDIIYEFLNAAKPQQNKKKLIYVNKLISDIMILFESEAIFRNLEIETVYECVNEKLYIDIKQIKQVLVNIIKNAIEAIDESQNNLKGNIRILTKNINGNAVILIVDNGIGMKKETIDQLFKPFFSTKETGTGIGLTVCKKIIEDHGGNIFVSSTPNHGTSFQIELPIYENHF
jgi:signal transduction histidine kinase